MDDQIYASQISRLVILGNSLSDAVNAQIAVEDSPKDKDKKGVSVALQCYIYIADRICPETLWLRQCVFLSSSDN